MPALEGPRPAFEGAGPAPGGARAYGAGAGGVAEPGWRELILLAGKTYLRSAMNSSTVRPALRICDLSVPGLICE